MRRILFLILIIFSFSCEIDNSIILDGNWIITEMTFKGKNVYPQTTNQPIELVYFGKRVERFSFNTTDSIVSLPGFNSKKVLLKYKKKKRVLYIMSSKNDSSQNIMIQNIFVGVYNMEFNLQKGNLKLKSDDTEIMLISEDKIFEHTVNKVFEGL